MSDHFVGLNRGQNGFAAGDFTAGSSTGSTDIELRVADAASLTREDVYKALKAFQRYFTARYGDFPAN